MRFASAAAAAGAVAVAAGAGFLFLHERQPSPEQQWSLLDRYCVDCHNSIERTADLAFDAMTPASVAEEPEIFESAVRKLRGHMMPPPGAPRPEQERVDSFVAWLESSLDRAAERRPNPGHVGVHRMNRTEYARAVQALLGVEINAAAYLPADDRSDGFDNIASVLKASPTYVDQYITAARDISIRAVGESAPKTSVSAYSAPRGVDQGLRVPGMPPGTRGGMVVEHWFPADGEYEFDIRLGARRGVEHRHRVIMTIDGAKVFEGEIGGDEELKAVDQLQATAQAAIRKRFEDIRIGVTAGPKQIGVAFVARALAESESTLHSFAPQVGGPGPTVSALEIVGPFEASGAGTTPSRRKIFVCTPRDASEEVPCAEEIIATLARRAYRGSVSEEDMGALLAFYATGRKAGDFYSGVRHAVMAILASPKFLYRAAPVPEGLAPGDIYPLDGVALASRLSYFLWSRMPDDELLNLAFDGRLADASVLEAQVDRLLADPRSESLVTNFASQWLRLYSLDEVDPNSTLFPEFDEPLREAFRREMTLFVDSILREDRPVVELLTAKHTFVNERLALHYGIPSVRGTEFRRIELDDPRRFGLFGKGAMLMATSYGDRTSPVLRGAWVLENILGTPPAAPPADVVTDLAIPEEGQFLTVRARLEQHRELPSCNGCHGVIDPPGLALENFDAIGQWRSVDRYARSPIDATGRLADGTPIAGPADLRDAIARHPEQFVQTLTEKLLTFALGRTVEYYDMPAVRKIVRTAAEEDYRFSSIVKAIVESEPFRMTRTPEADGAAENFAVNRPAER